MGCTPSERDRKRSGKKSEIGFVVKSGVQASERSSPTDSPNDTISEDRSTAAFSYSTAAKWRLDYEMF